MFKFEFLFNLTNPTLILTRHIHQYSSNLRKILFQLLSLTGFKVSIIPFCKITLIHQKISTQSNALLHSNK